MDALVLRDHDTDSNGSLDQRLFVQQDANFNVTSLSNTAGNVVERYVYDPYGQATVLTPGWGSRGTSSFAWRYLHQGGRYDDPSGLYHFRFRDHSPTLGRWVQQDPLGYVDGASLYAFVRSSPITLVDPQGTAGGRAPTWPNSRQIYARTAQDSANYLPPARDSRSGSRFGWEWEAFGPPIESRPAQPSLWDKMAAKIGWFFRAVDIVTGGPVMREWLADAERARLERLERARKGNFLQKFLAFAENSPLPSTGMTSAGAQLPRLRNLWQVTRAGTSRSLYHNQFGTFSQHNRTGLWWSRDLAGHGGSTWKVFREEAGGLRWIADADQFGDFIVGKHKGPTGMFVPWSQLN